MQLSPPPLFASVEDGLYRGGYPVLRSFNFLLRLNLKTIVSVVPEVPTSDLTAFCQAHGIVCKHIVAEKFKGDPQLLPTDVNAALSLVLDHTLHPMLIHCLDGRHIVGMLMMAMRKVQGWHTEAIEGEYQRFNMENMSNDEKGFLGDYNGGFMMPEKIPSWMWNGSWMENGRPKKHPLLKVKLPQSAVKKAEQHKNGDGSGGTDGTGDGGLNGLVSEKFGPSFSKEGEKLDLGSIQPVRQLNDQGQPTQPREVVTVNVPGMEAHALSLKSSLAGDLRFRTKEQRTGRTSERQYHPSKRTNSM